MQIFQFYCGFFPLNCGFHLAFSPKNTKTALNAFEFKYESLLYNDIVQ